MKYDYKIRNWSEKQTDFPYDITVNVDGEMFHSHELFETEEDAQDYIDNTLTILGDDVGHLFSWEGCVSD